MVLRQLASLVSLLLLASTSPAQSLLQRNEEPLPASPAIEAPAACPPGDVFFTQSTSQTIQAEGGLTCAQLSPPRYHSDNSWWRTFLPQQQFQVLGPVQVCEVQLGIEQATTPGGAGQPIQVNVGVTVDGIFPAGHRLVLGTANVTLPDMTNGFFPVPMNVVIPSGSEAYVEVHV